MGHTSRSRGIVRPLRLNSTLYWLSTMLVFTFPKRVEGYSNRIACISKETREVPHSSSASELRRLSSDRYITSSNHTLSLRSEQRPSLGDFRMYFGENPDKVKNIVTSTLGKFQDLYAPALKVRYTSRWLRPHQRDCSGFLQPPRRHSVGAAALYCSNVVEAMLLLLCIVPTLLRQLCCCGVLS